MPLGGIEMPMPIPIPIQPMVEQLIAAHRRARADRNRFGVPMDPDLPAAPQPPPGVGRDNQPERIEPLQVQPHPNPMDPPGAVRHAAMRPVGDNQPERIDPLAPAQLRNMKANPQAPKQGADWHFVPRVPRWTGEQTQYVPTLADRIVNRGHLGFSDQIQDAMDRMLQVNLANQQASGRNREIAAQVAIANLQAQAALEAQRIKAGALAAALGLGGGDGQGAGGKPRYTSNIGQSINWSGSW